MPKLDLQPMEGPTEQQTAVQPQPTTWEQAKAAFNYPVPGLSQVGNYVENTLPNQIAQKVGVEGLPGVGTMPNTAAFMAGTTQAVGQMIPQTAGQVGLQAFGGKIIGGASKLANRVAAAFLGPSSGLGAEAVMRISDDPKMLRKMGQMWDAEMNAHLGKVLDEEVGKIGDVVGQFEDRYSGYFGTKSFLSKEVPKVNVFDAADTVEREMMKKGVQKKIVSGLGAPASNIEGPASGLKPAQIDYLNDQIQNMKNVKEMTFGEALRTKRDLIQNRKIWLQQGFQGTEYDKHLKSLYNNLNSVLADSVPKGEKMTNPFTDKIDSAQNIWKQANSKYHDALDAMGELRSKAISDLPENTATRINSSMQRGAWKLNEARAERISPAAKEALNAARDTMIGNDISKLMPKNHHAAWYMVGPALGLSGHVGAGAAVAATQSPMLAGVAAGTLGAAGKLAAQPAVMQAAANEMQTPPKPVGEEPQGLDLQPMQ